MKLTDIKEGMVIQLDDGFTCRKAGPAEVKVTSEGVFYFDCDAGDHYLDGQECNNGELAGIS